MKNTHKGIAPLLAMMLLLCASSTLNAQNQGAGSAAHSRGCQSQTETDKATDQTSCIVDLKPGDGRLFAPSAPPAGKLSRWLDLQAASLGTQYVFAKNGLGITTANQQQYQVAIRGRFKLDAKGHVSVNAGLYTGASFLAGFNNTGLGMGEAQSNLYLKHLYLSALPFDGVEVQYGSLDIWHDESTDITGYAYNGYVDGERVSVKRPRELFFDDISVAFGYVGDLHSPNAIGRLNRLGQSNFHRFMLKKSIGERAWITTDYSYQAGMETWREAFRIRATELRVLDTFHAEIYEVSRVRPGYGFAAYGEKAVLSRLVVGGGYADIDRTMLNSDRFGRGKRLFLTTKIPINEAVGILTFATQATDHNASNMPQQRVDIGIYYNLLYHLRKTHIF
jgi:hypothetical protein